jgi:hypothetical protein
MLIDLQLIKKVKELRMLNLPGCKPQMLSKALSKKKYFRAAR